ncbi:MAG: response regulator [Melioribacteraceae bacterium]
MKIFIVDDNQRIRKLIKKHLDQLCFSFEIYEFENGENALHNFQYYHPDIILMDIMMKEMDGFTTTREIRKLSTDVKIIIVTQLPEEEYREEALNQGANNFINKENLSLLENMIKNFIKT